MKLMRTRFTGGSPSSTSSDLHTIIRFPGFSFSQVCRGGGEKYGSDMQVGAYVGMYYNEIMKDSGGEGIKRFICQKRCDGDGRPTENQYEPFAHTASSWAEKGSKKEEMRKKGEQRE